jgi:hypothetical protein
MRLNLHQILIDDDRFSYHNVTLKAMDAEAKLSQAILPVIVGL